MRASSSSGSHPSAMFFAPPTATGSGTYSRLFLVLMHLSCARTLRKLTDQNNLFDEDMPIYRTRFPSPSHAEAPSARRRTQLLLNIRPLIG